MKEILQPTPRCCGKTKIVPMLPGLRVIHHQERPVRNRGVAEYVGRKPEAVNR
jgi:hypothetical protein